MVFKEKKKHVFLITFMKTSVGNVISVCNTFLIIYYIEHFHYFCPAYDMTG